MGREIIFFRRRMYSASITSEPACLYG